MRGTKRVRIRFVFTVQHAGPHVKSQCAGIARYGSRPPTIKQATHQSPHQPPTSLPISHPPVSPSATHHQAGHPPSSRPPASLPISHSPSSRPPTSLPISHPPSSRPPARGGPIGINGSPCEGEAGHPQGVAP